ncbi:hypothetical protein [uncultured Christiangramia sp.]|nr:hypothetical protein [uncultured Christiangramia sp.]
MKDCCKTGNEKGQRGNGFKKWFNFLIFGIIVIIIIGALLLQLYEN